MIYSKGNHPIPGKQYLWVGGREFNDLFSIYTFIEENDLYNDLLYPGRDPDRLRRHMFRMCDIESKKTPLRPAHNCWFETPMYNKIPLLGEWELIFKKYSDSIPLYFQNRAGKWFKLDFGGYNRF